MIDDTQRNDEGMIQIMRREKNFSLLSKKRYGDPTVYFLSEDFNRQCLVAIPTWHWCFMIDFDYPVTVMMEKLTEALSVPMLQSDAEELADQIYRHALEL